MDLKAAALGLGIAGAGILVTAFVRFEIRKPPKFWLLLGAGLIVLAVIGAVQIVRAPPTDEETVDEVTPPTPLVPSRLTAIERLRAMWNSEAPAAWPVAATLATISETAYLPPVDADEGFRDLGFQECMPIAAGSMIGYVVSADEVTVVVFRGTDFGEASDWLANLDLTVHPTEHGGIHAGFYEAYLSLQFQVEKLLDRRKPKHLWITGHSLGGAIAVACAYDIASGDKYPLDGVITFGQPMVARRELADYLDRVLLGRYARFVNEADIVPRVPPNFVPCGSLVWFTPTGVLRSKPTMALVGAAGKLGIPEAEGVEVKPMTEFEFRQLQTRLRSEQLRLPQDRVGPLRRHGAVAAGPIDDHSMRLYVEKVRRLLAELPTP